MATWDPARRTATCDGCLSRTDPPPTGISLLDSNPGASARREYELRRDNRKRRAQARVGRLSGPLLWLTGEPAHQRNWARGAEAEVSLARDLENWTADTGVLLLHDRRIPGSRANIDHIAICPAGVLVIDAKRYRGRIEVRRRGGLFGAGSRRLIVDGRDKTALVEGALHQAEVVRKALGQEGADAPVRPVLCFVDGDWPWLARLELGGVPIAWPRRVAKFCTAGGALDQGRVHGLAELLATRLPPA